MRQDIFIGLMSGTSLDGIDAVAVRFTPECELVASHAEAIPEHLKRQVLQLTQPGEKEIDLMGKVDIALGELFAKTVNRLIAKAAINKRDIQAIGSHGQTIRHRPEFGFTLQIGDANIIAEKTGITTVADFRRRDMAASGQGAPLVPAFHQAMLQSKSHDRALLNIGGMANITYLPKEGNGTVIGFDTGPGNILMDAWMHIHHGQSYDKDAQWASKGKTSPTLLTDLLSLAFFSEPPPKSTGREQFHPGWLQNMLSNHPDLKAVDVQRTLLELTARSITDCITHYLPSSLTELYVCGGGSRNPLLMQRLEQLLPGINVQCSDALGINADWMEAAAFAWLAKQCMEGASGNIPSVTGAQNQRILGAIYQA
ncbi:MAG: anhydro-N-acetylmuramic acid kinase [Neptuniibacter caesariensis]|uniref:Anhydro-N-acetylmuramic acid kinase n=1 Tax=Neptuniibacter caesariensis TaxID=207954 RepID=A0A2G6JBM1_NEPCE|nr:MAG: anhydro-N-acetylmuramic acid kinase [Neptuniibacter caesariensis]